MHPAILKFYDSLNQQASEALVHEALHEDWIIHPGLAGNGTDREKYMAAVQPIFTGLPDFNINLDEVIQQGDLVAVRGHVTATHNGILFGIPATGKKITYMTCDFHRMRGDRIAESWHVEDWLAVLFQTGALK